MRSLGRRPLFLDERQTAAQVVGVVGAQPLALGMAAVQLGLDQLTDLDVVDDESLDEPGQLDVDQQNAVHAHTGQVGLAEHRTAEIGGVEGGPTQVVVARERPGHRREPYAGGTAHPPTGPHGSVASKHRWRPVSRLPSTKVRSTCSSS